MANSPDEIHLEWAGPNHVICRLPPRPRQWRLAFALLVLVAAVTGGIFATARAIDFKDTDQFTVGDTLFLVVAIPFAVLAISAGLGAIGLVLHGKRTVTIDHDVVLDAQVSRDKVVSFAVYSVLPKWLASMPGLAEIDCHTLSAVQARNRYVWIVAAYPRQILEPLADLCASLWEIPILGQDATRPVSRFTSEGRPGYFRSEVNLPADSGIAIEPWCGGIEIKVPGSKLVWRKILLSGTPLIAIMISASSARMHVKGATLGDWLLTFFVWTVIGLPVWVFSALRTLRRQLDVFRFAAIPDGLEFQRGNRFLGERLKRFVPRHEIKDVRVGRIGWLDRVICLKIILHDQSAFLLLEGRNSDELAWCEVRLREALQLDSVPADSAE